MITACVQLLVYTTEQVYTRQVYCIMRSWRRRQSHCRVRLRLRVHQLNKYVVECLSAECASAEQGSKVQEQQLPSFSACHRWRQPPLQELTGLNGLTTCYASYHQQHSGSKWLCYATSCHQKLSLSEIAKQIDLTSLSLPCPGRKKKKCHMVKSFPSPFHCTFQAPPCSECHNRHIILKGRTPFY